MSHFNEMASQWDTPEAIKSKEFLATKAKEILKISSEKFDILDFGCGTGLFGLAFLDCAKTLTGVDVSEGMLDIFASKIKNKSHVEIMNFDLEKQDLHKKFDLIITAMTFHHIVDVRGMVAKLRTMLNQSGRIVIVDLDAEDGTFHSDNAKAGVKHFGFSKAEIERWGSFCDMMVEHHIIKSIIKNNKTYFQFLAVLQMH